MSKQEYTKRAKIHTVYRLKDGTRVPGVTTILNELAKPALIHWAWGLGIKGIDYRVHRDDLANIGTLAHSMILCHLKGTFCETNEYSARQIDKAENCFLKYLEWESKHEIKPILVEKPLISELWKYGGQPDFYGKIDGIPTVMDFKTGKRIYDETLYQLAGYRGLIIEVGYDIEQYLALNIGRDETEKFEEIKRKDLMMEEKIFHHTFEVYKAKREARKGG